MIGLLTLLAGPAWATPCEIEDGMPVGPVTAGLLEGDLGRGHRACPRSEAALGGGGMAVVDTANFYGHLQAALVLDGSLRIAEHTEIFAALELFRYDQVIGAIPATASGLGHTAFGLSQLLVIRDNLAISSSGKIVLPTASGLYDNAWPYAADVGLAGAWTPHQRVRVHGYASLLGSVALSDGPGQPRGGVLMGVGAQARVARPFAIAGDLTAGFGYEAPVDVIAAGLALRFVVKGAYGIEGGATVPLAGRERALATADLRLSWRR